MLFKLLDFTWTGWADAFPKQGVHHCWIHDMPARTKHPRFRGHRKVVAAVSDQDAARWIASPGSCGIQGSHQCGRAGTHLTHILISDFKQRQRYTDLRHMAEPHQLGFGHLSKSRKAKVLLSPLTTPLISG